MWTLTITLLIGTITIETNSLEACQTAGFNAMHLEQVLQGTDSSDSYFFCLSAETGEIWTNQEFKG